MRHGPLRDVLVGVPGSMVTGASRELVANSVNPGLAGVRVSKKAWLFDGIGVVVGAAGLFLGNDVYEWTEPVLQSSLAYATQDATHEVIRLTKKPAVGTTVPNSVMRVQRADLVAPLVPQAGTATEVYNPQSSLEDVA